MKKIFILNGSGGVGKDTFVKLCDKYITTIHYSIAFNTKCIARDLGCYGKSEKDRRFLSDLLDLSAVYNDKPFKDVESIVKDFKNKKTNDDVFLFIDMREPKDIERAVNEFDAETILITNNKIKHIKSNHADASVYDYTAYDYQIENNGSIDDFEIKVKEFINAVISKEYQKQNKCNPFDCIDCEYNIATDDCVSCGKNSIFRGIESALFGYKEHDLVPVSYELLKEINNKLKSLSLK